MEEQFKAAVKLYQEVTGATQKQVAQKAEVDHVYLNKIMLGRNPISEMVTAKLIVGGIINPDRFPELVTDRVRMDIALATLKNNKVDLPAVASSIQVLVNKGIPASKIPAAIRAIQV